MKIKHYMITLLAVAALMVGMTVTASANEYHYDDATCVFNGTDMKISYPSGNLQEVISHMEPGDSVDLLVTYKNNSEYKTEWYMKNEVLETLEDNKDVAENGGYTYVLQNISPNKTRTTLFDNSEVGGEAKVADLEGLKQATNATDKYFFIQTLKPHESGQTHVKVVFDGETEVNDYMDTKGALNLAYAVEIPGDNGTTHESNPKTGDSFDIMKYVLLMTAALIIGIIAVIGWRRERKDGEQA